MKKAFLWVLLAGVSACATAPERAELLTLTGGTVAQRLDSGTLVLQITEE